MLDYSTIILYNYIQIERYTSPQEAIKAVRAYGGNCGVWFENGIYYIDKSHRVTTKKDALQLGREKNQISILQWRTMKLIYC